MPALAAFVQRRFGVRTMLNESLISVASTGTQLAGANPNRLALLLVNHGSIYATVTTRRPGAIDTGVRLDPSGGSAAFDAEIDGEGVSLTYIAFSSGANVNVAVWETIALDEVNV